MEMKKLLAIGIILLFVGTCIIPSEPSKLTRGKNIITVDDETGDGDYVSITEALNHANPGDIVEVYSGTYYEHSIIINKERISLIGRPYELGNGNDTGKPFINGQELDNVIRIKGRNNTISGFHIENSGGSIVIISWGADGCVVSDNDLIYSVMGCVLCASNYSKIINNTIGHSASRQGIVLGPYGHTTVSSNVITDVSIGIDLWGSSFNFITKNTISNCGEHGIYSAGGWFNVISYNTIKENPIGLALELAAWNTIKKNNFIGNSRNAAFWQANLIPGFNRWIQNYWGKPQLLPYPIHGTILFIFKWVNFDWHPAQKPYDIPQIK